jgi:hypothetical protein
MLHGAARMCCSGTNVCAIAVRRRSIGLWRQSGEKRRRLLPSRRHEVQIQLLLRRRARPAALRGWLEERRGAACGSVRQDGRHQRPRKTRATPRVRLHRALVREWRVALWILRSEIEPDELGDLATARRSREHPEEAGCTLPGLAHPPEMHECLDDRDIAILDETP